MKPPAALSSASSETLPAQATASSPIESLLQRHGPPIVLPKRKENILGGLKIGRTFSSEHKHPYDEVGWERRDVRVLTATGKALYERLGVEVPAHWDENAVLPIAGVGLGGQRVGFIPEAAKVGPEDRAEQ